MIAVLPGDGIGPEVIEQAVRVLDAVGVTGAREAKFGGCAIDTTSDPAPYCVPPAVNIAFARDTSTAPIRSTSASFAADAGSC